MSKDANKQINKCINDEMDRKKHVNKLILIVFMAIGAIILKAWGVA